MLLLQFLVIVVIFNIKFLEYKFIRIFFVYRFIIGDYLMNFDYFKINIYYGFDFEVMKKGNILKVK